MNLYERFNKSLLWDKINQYQAFSWIDIFDNANLNLLWLTKYHNRSCNSLAEDLDDDNLAKIIAGMFVFNWNIEYNLLKENWLKNGDFSKTYTEKKTEKNTETGTENNNVKNNVSAFDDENYTNKDEEVSTKNNENNGTNDVERTYITNGYNSAHIKSKIDYVEYLQKNNFFDTIIKDVNDLLTMNIVVEDD